MDTALYTFISYIYISSVFVFVTELLPNGWIDFDETVCVCASRSLNGDLDSKLRHV